MDCIDGDCSRQLKYICEIRWAGLRNERLKSHKPMPFIKSFHRPAQNVCEFLERKAAPTTVCNHVSLRGLSTCSKLPRQETTNHFLHRIPNSPKNDNLVFIHSYALMLLQTFLCGAIKQLYSRMSRLLSSKQWKYVTIQVWNDMRVSKWQN